MKKVLSLVLCALMLCALLCGCSSDEPTGSSGKPLLIMATNATFPPYEYYENEETIIGIDAEIAAAIADKLGMELKIEDMEFNSIISTVNAGGAHIGMAGMTVNDERKQQVDFSDSYAKGVQVVIVPENSSIQSVDDLAGKKIGVQLATTGDMYATEDFGKDSVTQYNKATDCVLALKSGDVDAVIIDNAPAQAFVEKNEGLKILDTAYADEDYAICVKKGNTELLQKINQALRELKADGTLQKIVDKYIPADRQ